MRRQRDERVMSEYMPALIVATLYNTSFKFKIKKTLSPELFMPSMQKRKKQTDINENVDKMMAIAKAVTAEKGGTIGKATDDRESASPPVR